MTNDTNWYPGMTLDQIEKKIILAAFRHYGGVQTTTANALGISVRTLRNKLVSYQVKGVRADDGDELDAGANATSVGAVGHNADSDSRTSLGRSGSDNGAPVKPQDTTANGVSAQSGVRLEPTSPLATERAVPVRERQEVQEVLPRGNPPSGTNRRKA